MPGRHPQALQPRDEKAHGVINHALLQGYLDTQAVYRVDGLAGHEVANEARKSVNRGGMHLNVSTPSWVVDSAGNPCHKGCQDPDAPHGVRFRLHSKNEARKYIVKQTGGDPANLRYNPFALGQGPAVDDSGRRLQR